MSRLSRFTCERGRSCQSTVPVRVTQEGKYFLLGGIDERNGSSFTATGVLGELGLSMRPIEYRFISAIRQLAPWLTCALLAQMPLVLIGPAYTGNEIHQFHELMTRERTPVSIPTTPSGILWTIDRPGRTQRYWVDYSVYGDVLGGRWDIFLETQTPLTLQSAICGFNTESAISDQYLRMAKLLQWVRMGYDAPTIFPTRRTVCRRSRF